MVAGDSLWFVEGHVSENLLENFAPATPVVWFAQFGFERFAIHDSLPFRSDLMALRYSALDSLNSNPMGFFL